MGKRGGMLPLIALVGLGCGTTDQPGGRTLEPGREAMVYAAGTNTVQMGLGPGQPGANLPVGTRVLIVEDMPLPAEARKHGHVFRVSVQDGTHQGTVGYLTSDDLRPVDAR